MRGEIVEPVILRQHRRAAAVEPQDQRGIVERAEHDRDAPVGGQMRLGFVPRSAKIEIGDAVGPSTRKLSIPLGLKLIRPPRAAVATKNIGCRSMKARCVVVDRGEEVGH